VAYDDDDARAEPTRRTNLATTADDVCRFRTLHFFWARKPCSFT